LGCAFVIGQYESRFGPLLYEVNDKSISRVWWGASDTNSAKTNEIMSKFWDDWFDDPTTPCPLLLHQCGTPFQEKVWSYIKTIPIGKTQTYGDVAKAIGHSKAYQAVGQACKVNSLPLLIPCHRVVGAQNKLTGYIGTRFIPLKSRLLKWEEGIHNRVKIIV